MNIKIIFGAPGTGKTTRIKDIIIALIEKGVSIDNIGLMSFTRKGTKTARRRVQETFPEFQSLPTFRTLHSYAFSLLGLKKGDMMEDDAWRDFGKRTGFDFKGCYTDKPSKADKYIHVLNLREHNKREYDRVRRSILDFDDYLFETIEELYNGYKIKNKLLDYTDILVQSLKHGLCIENIKHMFLDEAQDLTTLEWDVFWLFCRKIDNIYVVGDDDQSIYQWSGADPAAFNSIKGEIEILKESHRLPIKVLDFSQKFIRKIKDRTDKEIFSKKEVGSIRVVDAQMLDLNDIKGKWLILSRVNYRLCEVATSLRSAGVFHNIKGVPSIDVKSIDAVLRYTKYQSDGNINGLAGLPIDKGSKVSKNINWFDVFNWSTSKSDGIRHFINFCRREGKNVIDTVRSGPDIDLETIHSSKGSECENVLVYDWSSRAVCRNDELNPDMEIRTWYVGITRTTKNLYWGVSGKKYSYPLRELEQYVN